MIILGGFITLGTSQFSDTRFDFSTVGMSFETLWTMMLGNMLTSEKIPSTFWTNDKMLLIFSMLFNFLSFFFMLNFIIAIICESYINVSRRIKASSAHNEFFADCSSVMGVAITSLVFRSFALIITRFIMFARKLIRIISDRWPSHLEMIEKLSHNTKIRVGVQELRVLFPGTQVCDVKVTVYMLK